MDRSLIDIIRRNIEDKVAEYVNEKRDDCIYTIMQSYTNGIELKEYPDDEDSLIAWEKVMRRILALPA